MTNVSFGSLEQWNGPFPGPLEFAGLDGLEMDPQNEGLDIFFGAAKQVVEQWQGNQFAGLYLYGTPGTGKSHAAIGLGRALAESGADVFYKYVPELVTGPRPSIAEFTAPRSSKKVNANNNKCSVFPSQHTHVFGERNPKVALILDDYRPEAQRHLLSAIDAAAQYGGLVIVTSNYTDPFKILEAPSTEPATEQEALSQQMLASVDPQESKALDQRRQQAAQAISDSLRSRIAAGFKFIEFTGPDRRIQQSFWG